MSNFENKDFELYPIQEEETWEEFFSSMNEYWKDAVKDIKEDINETLSELDEITEDLADYTDDPEIMEMAVAAGRIRSFAHVTENAMDAIGKALGAVSSLYGENSSS